MYRISNEMHEQNLLRNKISITSLANLVTHQTQQHSQSLVCFVRMYALALVRMDVRKYAQMYGRTPLSKLMTTYDRWTWWVNKIFRKT